MFLATPILKVAGEKIIKSDMLLSHNRGSSRAARKAKGLGKVKHNLAQPLRHLKPVENDMVTSIKRKQADVDLQLAAEYRSIFENAVEGIFQTTPDGSYLNANPALARIYGYESPQELIANLRCHDRHLYVNPQRRTEFWQLLEQNDAVTGFESQVYRRDGQIIWILENARAVRDPDGNLLYCEGFVSDITERKLAEEKLRLSEAKLREQAQQLEATLQQLGHTKSQLIQSEKLSSLGQMLAGVAHEINNPVTFVCGNLSHSGQYAQDLLNLLELYQKYYPNAAPEIAAEIEAIDLEFLKIDFPKTLSSMQIGADRIRQIVQSLRTFARLDEAQMKAVDLHEGIDSTLLILQNRLKATGNKAAIAVLKEYDDLPLVECYAGLMNQVFMNILCNAIDALEDYDRQRSPGDIEQRPSRIRIRTDVVDNNCIEVRIADNGPGMSEEIRQRIFESFFTTKPREKGTGLGLSISHEIVVAKHNGELTCISAPEQGTEFVIKIPIQPSSC
jgi:PAS domain S-box-containing protein